MDRIQLDAALRDAGLRAGVEPRALEDFMARGLAAFKVDGGRVVPAGPRWSRYKPQEALGVEEWATELRDTAPHLFRK